MTALTAPPLSQRVVESLVTRAFRLPPQTTTYTIGRHLIPTRDGVDLIADVYEPAHGSGTILVRSPYGYPMPLAVMSGSWLARRGYRVVMARCRGTYGSGGRFDPFRDDVADGADTVAWLRRQPWFDGRFATYGSSYMGFVQWALLTDPPPEMVTAVVSVGPHDFREALYPGGAFSLLDYLGWAAMTGPPSGNSYKSIIPFTSQRAARRAASDLPVGHAADVVVADRAPWFWEALARPEPDDPFWTPMMCGDALERVEVPVLIQTGWQDLFVRQSFQQYERLAGRGVEVGLTVGPWGHGAGMGRIQFNETLEWLEQHLRGGDLRARSAPVRMFVTGADQWRDVASWPPPTRAYVLYPWPGRTLETKAVESPSRVSFTYDPADPTPSIGGPALTDGGYRDDAALASRPDVVTFTTEALRAPLEVIGRPIVELAHRTDNVHADLFVRLSEIGADDRSQNISDGFLRLEPARVNDILRIELDPVAHRFVAGKRVRLVVTGGAFPHWERNLGTGEPALTSTRLVASCRTIDLAYSRVILPITS